MSRIGLKPVVLPTGVTVTVNGNVATVKGPKGELSVALAANISVEENGGILNVKRANEESDTVMFHGTTRANLANAIKGVSEGFSKKLEIAGPGYRWAMKGDSIVISAGYSHEVVVKPLPGVKLSTQDENHMTVEGCDKQAVGQTAALIHDVRRPEPYGGRGIKYEGEYIIRKEGKRAAAGGK